MKHAKALLCLAAASLSSAIVWAADARWSTSVNDGIYTNDANWTTASSPYAASGFSRGPSETVFFDLQNVGPNASGEIRVAFEGNVTDYNRLCVRDVKRDVPLVFAVTNGASWYKGPGSMYNTYGFNLSQDTGQTGDNLSIRPASNNTTEPCFLITNALLSYTVNSTTGNRIRFSKGLWNWYDPSGDAAASPNNTMYVGYGDDGGAMPYDGLRFDVDADATLRGRSLKVAQHTMSIAGGDHTLFGELHIGLLKSGKDSMLSISGGTLGVTNSVYIGAKATSNRLSGNNYVHTLALSGTARMEVAGEYGTRLVNQVYARSCLRVSDSAIYRTKGFNLGVANCNDMDFLYYMAEMVVEDNAQLITYNGGQFGSIGSGRITLKDNAVLEQEGDNSMALTPKRGAMCLEGSATALIGGPMSSLATRRTIVPSSTVRTQLSSSPAERQSGRSRGFTARLIRTATAACACLAGRTTWGEPRPTPVSTTVRRLATRRPARARSSSRAADWSKWARHRRSLSPTAALPYRPPAASS